MDPTKKQQVCIKFCANIGKIVTETLAMIKQAFGEESMNYTQVFEWHAQFKTGWTSIEDNQHTVAKLTQLFREDQCQTIQDVADGMGIGYGSFQRILTTELGMHHVTAKFLPRILTADQKQQCISVCK
jgi:hypothetical protein